MTEHPFPECPKAPIRAIRRRRGEWRAEVLDCDVWIWLGNRRTKRSALRLARRIRRKHEANYLHLLR